MSSRSTPKKCGGGPAQFCRTRICCGRFAQTLTARGQIGRQRLPWAYGAAPSPNIAPEDLATCIRPGGDEGSISCDVLRPSGLSNSLTSDQGVSGSSVVKTLAWLESATRIQVVILVFSNTQGSGWRERGTTRRGGIIPQCRDVRNSITNDAAKAPHDWLVDVASGKCWLNCDACNGSSPGHCRNTGGAGRGLLPLQVTCVMSAIGCSPRSIWRSCAATSPISCRPRPSCSGGPEPHRGRISQVGRRPVFRPNLPTGMNRGLISRVNLVDTTIVYM